MKMVITDLLIDPVIYPRSGLSETNIGRMVDALKTGAKLPPIIIEARTNRVVDGRHRIEAHKRAKIDKVEVEKKSYQNDGDLYADAVRLNVGHGQPLDAFSMRRAVIRLESYGYTREAIADVIRVPIEKLEKIERGFAHNESGEPVAVKGGLSHLRGRVLSDQQQQINRKYSGPKATFLAKQLAGILESDLWPDKSAPFAEAMNRIVKIWSKLSGKRAA